MRLVGGVPSTTTRTASGGLLALSLLLSAGAAESSPASRETAERVVEDGDGEPLLARRRARQKSQKGKRAKTTEKPAAAETPAPGEQAPGAKEAAVDAATRQGPTRVEFDERLLQGQTNKANAIYLFQRRESALRSLVKKREHFHAEIDEALE